MVSPFEPDQWDRVAAELRALRDAQQEAWGTLDNSTLGRYLADEVSGEERRQIEQTLNELPELRKLTELVRDVLVEFEPVSVPAASVPPSIPAPPVLPFPRQPVPQRSSNRGFFGRTFRQRAALAAAACLLLTLALSIHGLLSMSPEVSVSRAPNARMQASAPTLVSSTLTPRIEQLEQRVTLLEKQGKLAEALAEAGQLLDEAEKAPREDPNYVAALNRVGQLYQQHGELARAEPAFRRAYGIGRAKLGANHPETVQSFNNLANSYQLALNCVPNDGRSLPAQPLPAPLMSRSIPDSSPTGDRPDKALRKEEERARQEALVVAGRMLRQSAHEVKEVVVPVLTQALRQAATPQERLPYIQALGRLGPAARDAVPALAAILNKAADPAERQAVVLTLGQMGPSADAALPLLTEALKSPDSSVCQTAGEALLRYGPQGRVVLHDLTTRGDAKQKAEAKRALREAQSSGRYGAGLRDTCYLFSPQIMNETQRSLDTLARNRGVAVFAETAAALDAETALERGKDAKEMLLTAEGIYLLICKEPPRLELQVSEKLRKQGFTDQQQKELRDVIEKHLKNRDYEAALREGIRYVDQFAQARSK